MADIQILDEDNTWVSIKFPQFVSTRALTNEHFRLFLNVSTPVEIIDPFNPINAIADYDSISRILTLYFKTQLNPDTPYLLTTSGLYDGANRPLLDDAYYFTTTDNPQVSPLVPVPEPVFVTDHSLVPDVFAKDSGFVVTPGSGFGILSYDPDDMFIEADTQDGRFDIVFSDNLDLSSLNPSSLSTFPANLPPKTIRVQRKLISPNATRWEYIDARITVNGAKVHIDFPSTDATPVFFTTGAVYYETGYKYRIKLSHNIKSSHGILLGEDKIIDFMVSVDPLFADVDQLAMYFPQATPIEITELVYGFSQEAIQLTGSSTPTLLMKEFVAASTACALSRLYDELGLADQEDFALGDLHITQRRAPKTKTPTRATATTWCELAGVLRLELGFLKSPMKAIVKGERVIQPMPDRQLKHQEWRSW